MGWSPSKVRAPGSDLILGHSLVAGTAIRGFLQVLWFPHLSSPHSVKSPYINFCHASQLGKFTYSMTRDQKFVCLSRSLNQIVFYRCLGNFTHGYNSDVHKYKHKMLAKENKHANVYKTHIHMYT